MSARQPRFEIVRADAGWFARFRAANGQKVWQTEVYGRRRGAERAINALWGVFPENPFAPVREVRTVDERTEVQP